jgi:hypothetical protein
VPQQLVKAKTGHTLTGKYVGIDLAAHSSLAASLGCQQLPSPAPLPLKMSTIMDSFADIFPGHGGGPNSGPGPMFSVQTSRRNGHQLRPLAASGRQLAPRGTAIQRLQSRVEADS